VTLAGKSIIVIGGSRGVGRRIVETAARHGARVLAVARREAALRQMAREVAGVRILALNATDEGAPARVFGVIEPDVLVLSAGACPPAAPLHQQTWRQFAVNWETDVRIAFSFCKTALARPLPAGASVIVISSGAALAGSPNSGGYAGAKRAQIFIAQDAQKESDRLGLGLHFATLAPRIMPGTELGGHVIAGYSSYLGMSARDLVQAMESPPCPSDVARAVVEVATNPGCASGKVFIVSGNGLEVAV
jgi:NAD(P)-dependent dehydrogenase (short-subunit alcohol dehydrogenase family)